MSRTAHLGIAFLLLIAGCSQAVAPPASPLGIAERIQAEAGTTVVRLDNGLTLIVTENHAAPVVCVQAGVRAGALYEGRYLGAGISHLTEHLVAEGAEHAPQGGAPSPQEKARSTRVDRIGGQSNAFTGQDDTNYYIAAAAGMTDPCIDLVADWMARAVITAEDFQREHGVVRRELEMGRERPERQLWEAHARNVYGTHPAAVPVIGLSEPLAGLTLADVLDYHGRMYVPQNMVFAVVGDVETEKVLDRVRRAFAGFASGPLPDLLLPEVPPAPATRCALVTHPAGTQDEEMLSFLTIPLLHEDLYALDVLSDILTHGESARLNESIKRRQRLVTGVSSASWTPPWGKGQFTIHFRCAPGSADAAEKAVVQELRKVVADGVTEAELARAKRQKTADFVYSRQTVESQAGALISDYLSTGDVSFSRRYTERIQQLTAGQVQAAARKYFDFDRMIITRMVAPKTAAEQAAASRPAGKAPATTFALPNGLRVILQPAANVGLVSTVLVARGGLLLETPQTNGMGTLMTALSTRGAGDLTAEQISEFFDSAGGSLSAQCGNNTFYWRATVLSDSFDQALPILADVVQRPTYPQKELDIFRPILLDAIRRNREQWFGRLNEHFRRDFFGSSPLALLPTGSPEVISSAGRQAVADYRAANVKAGSSVLAIYGRFDAAAARAQVEKLFAALPVGEVRVPDAPAPVVPAAGRTQRHVEPATSGASVMIGAAGMKITDLDDLPAVTVLDTIISGYQLPSGWLHEELRGRQLVYAVHAYNFPALVPGAFIAYAHCEPDKAQQVVDIIRRNLRKTLNYPFTPEEIDQAVNIILTADNLDNQEMPAMAMQAALDELYGFGYDFRRRYEQRLRAVRPADVTRVARKYLGGGLMTVIVTAPAEPVRAGGPVPTTTGAGR